MVRYERIILTIYLRELAIHRRRGMYILCDVLVSHLKAMVRDVGISCSFF